MQRVQYRQQNIQQSPFERIMREIRIENGPKQMNNYTQKYNLKKDLKMLQMDRQHRFAYLRDQIENNKNLNNVQEQNDVVTQQLKLQQGIVLKPLNNNQYISLRENYQDYHIEKFINMINIDNEVLYIGCSFRDLTNDDGQKYLSSNQDSPKRSKYLKELPHLSCQVRSNQHYSSNNLLSLSNRTSKSHQLSQLQSNEATSQSTKSITILKQNDYLGGGVNLFGVQFPILTKENFKQNIGQNSIFLRIVSTQNNNDTDVGFLEFTIKQPNSKNSYLDLTKLYIFKVFRKMKNTSEMHQQIFQKLFEIHSVQYIQLTVLFKLDSYKKFLLELGFSLLRKIKIKDEIIDQLILKRNCNS